MNTFLGNIGTNIGDRVLRAVTLPGLLWTTCLALGWQLGYAHALSYGRLSSRLKQLTAADQSTGHTLSEAALVLGSLLLVGVAAGLAASGIGTAVEWFWGNQGTSGPIRQLVQRRHKRWEQAASRVRKAVGDAMAARSERADSRPADDRALVLRHRQLRISPREPERPTWIGERFALTADRAREVNGVDDIDLVWPRLWPVLPEALRADITAARDAHADAARLCAWGVMYVPVSVTWWPAVLVVLAVLITGHIRGRSTARAFADLVEAALDLHLGDLAKQLGLELASDRPMDERGAAITKLLRHKEYGS
ncbi:hypothetical protein ACFVW8_31790 [Streptomyces sp. NPDC058221]|uniref:hypothetical protein n=1 Tax=Streptomyces sp. NPDC058221 TaxID=3346388 RepID=UPI0036ED0BE8